MKANRLLLAVVVAGMASGCAGFDRAAGTNLSGAYPAQSDGTRNNPPGTAATRAVDRAAGTNLSGAYPAQSDGMPGNPRGTVATRAIDRAACTNISGAYVRNDGTPCDPGTSRPARR